MWSGDSLEAVRLKSVKEELEIDVDVLCLPMTELVAYFLLNLISNRYFTTRVVGTCRYMCFAELHHIFTFHQTAS